MCTGEKKNKKKTRPRQTMDRIKKFCYERKLSTKEKEKRRKCGGWR
jgi:hypothetical protein